MFIKSWRIKSNGQAAQAECPGVSRVILQLLHNRGVFDFDDIKKFLRPNYEDLHDPFLFKDMEKAMDRIKKAKESGEKIFVYGDYDADGVCSSVLISEALKNIGIQDLGIYIPHREKEGYGINKHAIDFILTKKASLIISVDCGISSNEEISYAKSKGIDVIVIDHHEEPLEKPKDACAVLNPHSRGETYPFLELSATGVVFKTVQAIWKFFGLKEGMEKWFLDLVAIATVSDMMRLVGENRIFVSYGLVVLNKTKRPGLKTIIKTIKTTSSRIGTYEIGFMIGPRLNSAGRMDHANSAFELLAAQDPIHAQSLALGLERKNSSRQSETERIFKQAQALADEQIKDNKVLVIVGDNWQPGVVGLVAGRITEKYHRPSLVITRLGNKLVGSGRSIEGFNITEAIEKCSDLLLRFGGHEGACGFTVKSENDLTIFEKRMNEIASLVLSENDLVKILDIDMKIELSQTNISLVEEIESMGPFGIGNPTPKFASFGVRVESANFVGGDKHLKIRLSQGNFYAEAISFGFKDSFRFILSEGDLIDIAYELSANIWNGHKSVQLKIIDIKKQ